MLTITISDREVFDEEKQEFEIIKGATISLEHSLISISKWESKWHKSFLSTDEKTTEEFIDYIKCMTVTQNVDPQVYLILSTSNLRAITNYMDDPMTATTINSLDKKRSGKKERVTSELIYYWMVAFNVPFECQKWHLNRLLMLIQICKIKNEPPKKMTRSQIFDRNRMINEANKAKFHTKG